MEQKIQEKKIEEKKQSFKGQLGGARPNAGRPSSETSLHSIARAAAKKRIEERVIKATDQLINAQLSIARGISFLYKIEKQLIIGPKGGKSYKPLPPKLVTTQWEIELYLNGLVDGDMDDENDPEATYYYIFTKEPNNMALDSLQNRVYGKPKETIDHTVEVFSLKNLAQRAREVREQEEQKAIEAQATENVPEHLKVPEEIVVVQSADEATVVSHAINERP